MTPEDNTARRRVCGDEVAQSQSEVEPRTLPVEPSDVVAVALLDEALAVVGGRQRDHRVGMGVVDVWRVEERVQRRVDRRRRATDAESARLVVRHEVVLRHARSRKAFERAEPGEVEASEAVGGEGAEIAARALDHQHHRGRAGDGVVERHLDRCVAPGVVRDPPVGPEPVRAREQRIDLRVPGSSHVP